MTDGVRALVRVSAAIGRGDRTAVVEALENAAVAAASGEVEEVLLQSHLFVGYPAMLQAIAAWRALAPALPVDARDDNGEWRARGERVCATIYGAQYERLLANIAQLHPVLDRWMLADGYGRVLGRPGLALDTRELCIIALLCPQDVPEQLYAHLRGALNAGASEADVEEAVTLTVESLSADRRTGARARWEIVRSRKAGTD